MSLSIIYALIAKENKIILADYSEYSGNTQQAAILLLKKIPKNAKMQIDYPPYMVFCEEVDDIIYLLIASNIRQEVAFSFLSDLRNKFINSYESYVIKKSYSYTLKNFTAEIKTIARFYEDNQNYIKNNVLKDEKGNKIKIEEKKIDEILKKEEKIDINSTRLSEKGIEIYDQYKIKTKLLEKKRKSRAIKLAVGIGLIFLILLIIIKHI